MKTNPLKQRTLIENSSGCGTVTRGMVRERAVELAVINGHAAQEVSKTDCEQAKRELKGGPDTDPNQAVLESAPEAGRWNPVPSSTGHKVPVTSNEDEDDEGRSDRERLAEEGVKEAGHDQMLQAARTQTPEEKL